MKKFRWQLIIIFLTGLVIGGLLLLDQPQKGTTITAPEPVKGGSYAEALIGSFQRLNPLLDYYHAADRSVDTLIFGRLFSFDPRGNPIREYAETYGVSADGTIYNVSLRANVKWHDGKPVTSQDVVFTIEMMRQGDGVIPADLIAFWKEVDVKALDENTIQFRLPEPFAPFLDYLTFGILPDHLLNGMNFQEMIDSPFNLQPVGFGPYQFDQLVVENGQIKGVSLKAFESYYNGQAFIQRMIFMYYSDSTAALDAYRNGMVQGISEIDAEILDEALSEPDLSVYTGRSPQLSLILFNLKDSSASFLQSADVRRALYMAINRQALIDRLMNGQGILADSVIFPESWAYYEGNPRVEYDPTRAQQILSEAGYVLPAEGDPIRAKEEVALKFTMLYPDGQQYRLLAEAIQKNWQAIGVAVTIEPVSYDILVQDRLYSRAYQAALVDLNLSRSPDPDPYPFWDQVQATGDGQNYTQWDHAVASQYLEDARVTVDQTERARLYRNFQVLFSENLPALPLYYPVYSYGVSNEVQGIRMGPLYDSSDRFATVMQWFLAVGKPSATQAPTQAR